MNLHEHQSTYCPNMPLRGLGYFANLYEIVLCILQNALIELNLEGSEISSISDIGISFQNLMEILTKKF